MREHTIELFMGTLIFITPFCLMFILIFRIYLYTGGDYEMGEPCSPQEAHAGMRFAAWSWIIIPLLIASCDELLN